MPIYYLRVLLLASAWVSRRLIRGSSEEVAAPEVDEWWLWQDYNTIATIVSWIFEQLQQQQQPPKRTTPTHWVLINKY